jgi:hypothetical protein
MVGKAALRHRLEEVARWIRMVHGRKMEVTPPIHVIEDLLALPDHPARFPMLDMVVTSPVFAPDGSLASEPGYHAGPKAFYDPRGLKVPDLPDLSRAKTLLLDELMGDFPFADQASRCHALALLLLPLVRPLIDGVTPLHMIEAPTIGSGKGLLTDMTMYPVSGGQVARLAECSDNDEWRKRITATLASGPQVIVIDNITEPLDSGALAMALTTQVLEDRILGSTRMLRTRNRATWIATGNNPSLSAEMARRTLFIRIDPQMEQPWHRSGFRHPDLRGWAESNRGQLVASGLAIIKTWLDEGRPEAEISFGDFGAWARTMGGILEVAGVAGFLGNAKQRFDLAAVELEELRGFVRAWWRAFEGNPATAAEILEVAELDDAVPTDLDTKSDRSRRTAFGMWLSKLDERVIDDKKVRRLPQNRDGVREYQLVADLARQVR